MTRFRELPQSAQERINALPQEAKDLYMICKDVAHHFNDSPCTRDGFTSTVFWQMFLDAIEAVEGRDDPDIREEQIPW